MRYINKNQITEFIIEKVSDSKIKNAGKKWYVGIYLLNNDVIESIGFLTKRTALSA